MSLAVLTLSLGVSALTTFENLSVADAIHLSVITGTFSLHANVVLLCLFYVDSMSFGLLLIVLS
jgi:hypothetical protein